MYIKTLIEDDILSKVGVKILNKFYKKMPTSFINQTTVYLDSFGICIDIVVADGRKYFSIDGFGNISYRYYANDKTESERFLFSVEDNFNLKDVIKLI
jgi:hypothetical protein